MSTRDSDQVPVPGPVYTRDDADAAEVLLRREHAQALKEYIEAASYVNSDRRNMQRNKLVAARDELAFYLDAKAEAAKLATSAPVTTHGQA
jgi:hypothetical protein